MKCLECLQEILPDQQTITGPKGTMHYKCFMPKQKWIYSKQLVEKVDALEKRIRALEQRAGR